MRFLRVEVKENGWICVGLKNETVRLRLDDRVHAGSNPRVRWQVRQDFRSRRTQVRALPAIQRLRKRLSLGGALGRKDKAPEVVVGEVTPHRGFAFFRPLIRPPSWQPGPNVLL